MASIALPQPDADTDVLGAAAAAVVDDCAAARPTTPRRTAAEKRMFATGRMLDVESFVYQGMRASVY